jgi:hypothetical protein
VILARNPGDRVDCLRGADVETGCGECREVDPTSKPKSSRASKINYVLPVIAGNLRTGV